MESTTSLERRIQLVIIIISLLWNGFIALCLFVFTGTDFNKPLRITIRPRPIEYSLYSQLPRPQPIPPQVSQAQPAIRKLVQQAVLQNTVLDDDKAETYLVKNPVSCGTLSRGSVVTVAGGGDGGGSPAQGLDNEEKSQVIDNGQQEENPREKVQESDELSQSQDATEQQESSPASEQSKQSSQVEQVEHSQPTGFNEPNIAMPSDATTSMYSPANTVSQAPSRYEPTSTKHLGPQNDPHALAQQPRHHLANK